MNQHEETGKTTVIVMDQLDTLDVHNKEQNEFLTALKKKHDEGFRIVFTTRKTFGEVVPVLEKMRDNGFNFSNTENKTALPDDAVMSADKMKGVIPSELSYCPTIITQLRANPEEVVVVADAGSLALENAQTLGLHVAATDAVTKDILDKVKVKKKYEPRSYLEDIHKGPKLF